MSETRFHLQRGTTRLRERSILAKRKQPGKDATFLGPHQLHKRQSKASWERVEGPGQLKMGRYFF